MGHLFDTFNCFWSLLKLESFISHSLYSHDTMFNFGWIVPNLGKQSDLWPSLTRNPLLKTRSPPHSAICSLSVPQSVQLHRSLLPSFPPNQAPLSFFFPFYHYPLPSPPLCACSLAVSNHSALIPAFRQPQECLNNVALSFNCYTGTKACVCVCVFTCIQKVRRQMDLNALDPQDQ